jgi:ATP-dependent DNA helicase RecG
MIDPETLEQFFRTPEGEGVERKRNANDLDSIRETICAFANDLAQRRRPAIIFIGLENNGDCSNIAVTDRLLTTLAGTRLDGKLTPFPVIAVEQATIDGCTFAFVAVAPTDNPPIKMDNIVYVRVGPTTRRATTPEEQTLVERRRWGVLPYDAHAVVGSTIDDLDLRRFELEILPALVNPDAVAANSRTLEQRLLALRLIRPDGTPTTAAILILGKSPLDFLPGAYVQILRLAGTELTSPVVDQREISGPLPDQLRQIDEYVELSVRHSLEIGGPTHAGSADFPVEAIRQLVRNALIHRSYEGTNSPVRITWYSDRIEINSPGGPFGQVTAENFGAPGVTDYRNPTLAALLKDLGFVERFGVGIAIARRALSENGNPPPEFTVLGTHVHATMRSGQ